MNDAEMSPREVFIWRVKQAIKEVKEADREFKKGFYKAWKEKLDREEAKDEY